MLHTWLVNGTWDFTRRNVCLHTGDLIQLWVSMEFRLGGGVWGTHRKLARLHTWLVNGTWDFTRRNVCLHTGDLIQLWVSMEFRLGGSGALTGSWLGYTHGC